MSMVHLYNIVFECQGLCPDLFLGAVIYENQRAVGQGIKEGMRREGLKREDIWITSKLWSDK